MTNGSPADDVFIQKLQSIIQAKMSESDFGVKELAREMGMSRSNLHRRVSEITGKTVVALISEARLTKAIELLKEETYTVSEVAWKSGFGSPTYFIKCFHEYFGYSPGEVKKRELNGYTINNIESSLTSEIEKRVFDNLQVSQPLVKKRRIKLLILSGAGVLILVILSLIFFKNSRSRLESEDKSIAVLPFKNLSDDTNNQYFADGMMEEILNHLNQIGELRVISRTSVEQFRGKTPSMHEIVKKLGVSYILEGSVLQYGGKVRIMVKLIDAKNDQYILTKQYDAELSDIFQIQGDIAKQVSSALNVVISSKVIKRIEKPNTGNMEAYSYYLKGIYFLNKRTREDVDNTINYLKKAIDADPLFAEAYSAMAEAYYLYTQRRFFKRPEGYIKSKEFALKALELDNNLAEAHAIIGAILAAKEWKWEEAAKEYELATELNPSSETAHKYYAELLMVMRRPGEAREQIDIALKLNPTSHTLYLLSAIFYLAERKCEEGLKECQKIIELNPPNYYSVYYVYFELYRCLGNDLKALESLQKAFSFIPEDVKYISKVKEAYDQSGMTGLLKCWIEQEMEDMDKGIMGASIKYAIIGEKKKALDYLEKAFKMNYPGLPNINYDPRFDNIRHEPRFQALLNSMGLKQYQTEMYKSQITK